MAYTYIPMYIAENQEELPRNKISADHWNQMFNRIITQGDNSARALEELINKRAFQLGPRILDGNGNIMPDTKNLKFVNTTITQEGDTTFVQAIKGDQGDVGVGLLYDWSGTSLGVKRADDPLAFVRVNLVGPIGPVGPAGNDFVIIGHFASLGALESAHPTGEIGDAYSVGVHPDATVYVWGSGDEWVDVGPVRGPEGPEGPEGPRGLQGIQGIAGPLSSIASEHVEDTIIHITAGERTAWNGKTSVGLGETSVTAYRGDRGKIAYDHSQTAHQAPITGGASTITAANLTAARVLISSGAGKVDASSITTTELSRLSGITSGIQTQLDGKLASGGTAANSNKVGGQKITVSYSAPSGPATYDVWIDI